MTVTAEINWWMRGPVATENGRKHIRCFNMISSLDLSKTGRYHCTRTSDSLRSNADRHRCGTTRSRRLPAVGGGLDGSYVT